MFINLATIFGRMVVRIYSILENTILIMWGYGRSHGTNSYIIELQVLYVLPYPHNKCANSSLWYLKVIAFFTTRNSLETKIISTSNQQIMCLDLMSFGVFLPSFLFCNERK